MKTSELVKGIISMGFGVEADSSLVIVKSYTGLYEIAKVARNRMYEVNTRHQAFSDLEEDKKEMLYHLLYGYVSTPVERREEVNEDD